MPVENLYYFLFIRERKNLYYEGNGYFTAEVSRWTQ